MPKILITCPKNHELKLVPSQLVMAIPFGEGGDVPLTDLKLRLKCPLHGFVEKPIDGRQREEFYNSLVFGGVNVVPSNEATVQDTFREQLDQFTGL